MCPLKTAANAEQAKLSIAPREQGDNYQPPIQAIQSIEFTVRRAINWYVQKTPDCSACRSCGRLDVLRNFVSRSRNRWQAPPIKDRQIRHDASKRSSAVCDSWRIQQSNPGIVSWLLDYLVRPIKHRLRNRQTKLLGGLEIYDRVKLGRLCIVVLAGIVKECRLLL
jgi:hypothetical protein